MASQQTHHFTQRALMDIEGEFFDLRRFAMLNSMNQNFLARKDLRALPSPLIVVGRPGRRLLEGDVTSLSRGGFVIFRD